MRYFSWSAGQPGFPNVRRSLRIGGAILFETPDDGVIEVRVFGFGPFFYQSVDLLVTRISRGEGITAGFVQQETGNAPFELQERARIAEGFKEVRDAVAQRTDVTPEQTDFVCRKLDELERAAERFGRRDWINLVVGTLTNTIVSAALGTDIGRFLFQAVGKVLSWLFTGPVRFLP